ncbi:hypothetical protein [Psychromicrobium lacuslunae]|uniref:Peptidase metallopeptidase domain-containing protein n=1 Tax=Psychromicrobium lacuslunae TaxID=1618207 RepID=A0A0D4BZQ5_9MICC|nr:hypothetical protein [Psychromicrobium lacuslunae]AJT41808.1 hypothetical protein UM93_10275 [Psychromicrobium lacuslunae]
MLKSRIVAASIVGSVVAAAFIGAPAALATGAPAFDRKPSSLATITVADTDPAKPTYVGPTQNTLSRSALAAPTATFQVNYTGFTPEAQAAFQRAVDIWASKISSPVPITIDANFSALAPGVLGQAGASALYKNFPGAEKTDTYYVDAIANKQAGKQLDPSADIQASFSSSFTNWHFGAEPAPAGKYDFTSVVLHELGHGLGFLGAGNVSGTKGTVRYQNTPISYDLYTKDSAGNALTSFANNSSTLATKLTSGNLSFDSSQVRTANNGNAAKIYAPSSWEGGSSYSHLDESTYPAGNPNSLLTPKIGKAETIRDPGSITLAILDTIGW